MADEDFQRPIEGKNLYRYRYLEMISLVLFITSSIAIIFYLIKGFYESCVKGFHESDVLLRNSSTLFCLIIANTVLFFIYFSCKQKVNTLPGVNPIRLENDSIYKMLFCVFTSLNIIVLLTAFIVLIECDSNIFHNKNYYYEITEDGSSSRLLLLGIILITLCTIFYACSSFLKLKMGQDTVGVNNVDSDSPVFYSCLPLTSEPLLLPTAPPLSSTATLTPTTTLTPLSLTVASFAFTSSTPTISISLPNDLNISK